MSGTLATKSVLSFIDGDYGAALVAGMQALDEDVQIVFDDEFNHPLFWTMAAQRRLSDGSDEPDLLGYASSARPEFGSDAQSILDLYLDRPSADDASLNCTTPGCHFFVAQYFESLGRSDLAREALDAGAVSCEGTRSVVCAAIDEVSAQQQDG